MSRGYRDDNISKDGQIVAINCDCCDLRVEYLVHHLPYLTSYEKSQYAKAWFYEQGWLFLPQRKDEFAICNVCLGKMEVMKNEFKLPI